MANMELVKTCVDYIKSPEQVKQFSKGKDVDAVIRGKFFELMGTEKPTQKDVRRHEVAVYEILEQVLTETYLNGINEDEFFMRFAETRNLALGESQEFFIEDDGVVIVSEHSGNHWRIDRQKLEGGASFTIQTKAYAAAVYGDFFLFLTGRLSFGRLIAKVGEGIQKKIASEVAASFASGAANLPAAFKKSGAYDRDLLLNLVSHVEAVAGSAYVVGTKSAIGKITAGANVALYTESMKNELATTGRVTNFDGMTLVQLPAIHKANSFDFAYDDDRLLVLPANDDRFIKIVFEGDDMIKQTTEHTENQDMSLEYKFITKFGVKTIFSSLFGEYKFIV